MLPTNPLSQFVGGIHTPVILSIYETRFVIAHCCTRRNTHATSPAVEIMGLIHASCTHTSAFFVNTWLINHFCFSTYATNYTVPKIKTPKNSEKKNISWGSVKQKKIQKERDPMRWSRTCRQSYVRKSYLLVVVVVVNDDNLSQG